MSKTRVFFAWLFGLAFVAMVGFFSYKMYTFQPRGPDELKAMIAKSHVQTAQAIARAQLIRMERRLPPPQLPACRQLPVRINRAGLTFWGRNELNQPVPLQKSFVPNYSGEEVYDIMSSVVRYTAAMTEAQDPPKPPEAAALKIRLQKSRERIVSLADVPCAYEWNIIRSIVLSHGDQLILRNIGEVDPLAEYDARKRATSIYQEARRIAPEEAEKLSDLALTLQMVENATALIFARSVTILSGYTPDQLDALRTICVPFNVSYAGHEKVAIIWNAGRFLSAIQNSLSDNESFIHRKALKAIQDVDRGSSVEVLRQMEDSLTSKEAAFKYMESKVEGRVSCDFPPVLSGSNQGARIYPDELNDPIINFVNIATSEQSKIALNIH